MCCIKDPQHFCSYTSQHAVTVQRDDRHPLRGVELIQVWLRRLCLDFLSDRLMILRAAGPESMRVAR